MLQQLFWLCRWVWYYVVWIIYNLEWWWSHFLFFEMLNLIIYLFQKFRIFSWSKWKNRSFHNHHHISSLCHAEGRWKEYLYCITKNFYISKFEILFTLKYQSRGNQIFYWFYWLILDTQFIKIIAKEVILCIFEKFSLFSSFLSYFFRFFSKFFAI